MTTTVLEATLRRDRVLVAASLAALTALSWLYLAWLAASMDMGAGMAMAPAIRPWDPVQFGFMFVMWAVMMVGMMTPSAAPMILLYARVGRHAGRGRPLAATGCFGAGYLAAWTAFSLGATLAQWGLEQTLLLSPMMVATSNIFAGLVLMVAGAYQWTSLKHACLTHCRSPLVFIQHRGGFRPQAAGSFQLGFRHGLYCVGCCWALMALLFVVGVMNLLWIAALAVFVLLEKLVPAGRWLARAGGIVMAATGTWLFLAALN